MCKQCEKKSVYEFTNQRKLCANCFVSWFRKKVLFSIRKFNMIDSGDVVGYVSGKDIIGTQGRTPKNIQKNIFTRGIVLEDVLKMFEGKWDVEIRKLHSQARVMKKTNNKENMSLISSERSALTKSGAERVDKIAVSDTTDVIANEIIQGVFEGNVKGLKMKPVEGKIIRPLYLFLDKEVLLYAKLRGLKYSASVPLTRPKQDKLPASQIDNVSNKKTNLVNSCGDSRATLERGKLVDFINDLEKKHPEIKQAIVQDGFLLKNILL